MYTVAYILDDWDDGRKSFDHGRTYEGLSQHTEKSRNTENISVLEFPGGAVVKNPPANAGDMGSIPGPGRSHMPQSNKACALQLLSLHSRAHEPQLLSPLAATRESPHASTKTQHSQK